MPTEKSLTPYNTLEEIRLRKDQLSAEIERDNEQIGGLWNELFHKQESSSKGEYVATLIANSVTAIDAFLLVRKLMKNYGSVLNLFGGKSKKNLKR